MPVPMHGPCASCLPATTYRRPHGMVQRHRLQALCHGYQRRHFEHKGALPAHASSRWLRGFGPVVESFEIALSLQEVR